MKCNILLRHNDSRLFMSIIRMNAETALIPESFSSNALKIAALPLDAHATSLLHAAAGATRNPQSNARDHSDAPPQRTARWPSRASWCSWTTTRPILVSKLVTRMERRR
jgi:hypothetical protein